MAVSQQLMYNYKFDQLVSDSVLVDVVSGNNGILKGNIGSTSLSDGPLEGVKYKWSTGDTTATISVAPKVTTKYYVTVSSGVITRTDSVLVQVRVPIFNPLLDTILVCGLNYKLNASTGFKSYKWNTNDTTSSITINRSGRYALTVLDSNACYYKDSTYVSFLSAQLNFRDTTISKGSLINLTANSKPKVINNLFGGSNYFEMPLPGPLGANPRTFAYWIKTGNQLPMTVLTYGSSANGGYDLMDLCLNLNMSYGADNAGCSYNKGVSFFANAFGATFGKPVADSSWHHIAYVMGANNHTEFANMDVYVDGKLVSKGGNGVPFCGHNWQANSNWTFNTSSSKMRVGYKYGTNNPYTNYYKGSLSDLGVWSTALDSSQISSIIKGGAMSVSQQLMYNYKFDQLVSDSVLVDVVSGNNGILKGSLGSTSLSDGPLEGVKYKWSTGDTTATISVAPKVTTKYYVTVSNGIFSCVDSMIVRVDNFHNRNINVEGIAFSSNYPVANTVYWTVGTITYTNNLGNAASKQISAQKKQNCGIYWSRWMEGI
jgi:hypothetical protein